MKIIGKNSLLYWIKYPFGIYTIGFTLISFWILTLIANYMITGNTGKYISIDQWQKINDLQQNNNETVQFHHPFTKMVLSTKNSTEGVTLAFIGIIAACYILITVLAIVNELSKDNFFTSKAVFYLKILGFGLIFFGGIHLAIDLVTSLQSFDLTPPFFFIITGFIFIFLKEIFAKGKKIQEENELTI